MRRNCHLLTIIYIYIYIYSIAFHGVGLPSTDGPIVKILATSCVNLLPKLINTQPFIVFESYQSVKLDASKYTIWRRTCRRSKKKNECFVLR